MYELDVVQVPSPAFVLEEKLLRRNLELMRCVQEASGARIILALKGFAMWKVFPIVSEYLSGATASSLCEAQLIYEEMGCKAHTYAVAYQPDEFEELLHRSSHLVFNSVAQLERFRAVWERADPRVSIGLRVNPGWSDVAVALYNPAVPDSRLGEPPYRLADGLPDGVEGLHFHVLCESSSHSLEKVLDAFERHYGHLLPRLKWVNMGGGHLMTRKGYDLDHLVALLRRFREKWEIEVILEPGAAVAWEAGTLVATVLDIHESHGVHTAILDVSFTAHMPDTLEMPYKPRILGASLEPRPGQYACRMGGISCLAGDYMSAYGFDAPLQVGDRIAFEDMIHYTMVKTTMFNGVRHPDIGIWRPEGRFELVRRFRYEDYKHRLS